MGFIEFPFVEVPKDLRKIVGEPTPGTRAYRREGTHAECGQWIEDLGLHYKGDVGISPAGVKHRQTFRKNYLNAMIGNGWLGRTIPDKPQSRLRHYQTTEAGKMWLLDATHRNPNS